ncbi:MAG: hypothetical protein QW343_01880 [Candidatus Norongarragalinales archaeon]
MVSFGVPATVPPAPKRDVVEKYFDVDGFSSAKAKSAKGKSDQSLWSRATARVKKHFLKN